jgi:hypothetical protein
LKLLTRKPTAIKGDDMMRKIGLVILALVFVFSLSACPGEREQPPQQERPGAAPDQTQPPAQQPGQQPAQPPAAPPATEPGQPPQQPHGQPEQRSELAPRGDAEQTRDTFVTSVQQEFDELDRRVEELRARIAEQDEQTQARFSPDIEELQKKRDRLDSQLTELRSTTGPTWENMREDVKASIEDLRSSYQETVAKLS